METIAPQKRWWIAAVIAGVALLVIVGVVVAASSKRRTLTVAVDKLMAASALHTEMDLDLMLPVRVVNREQPFKEVEFRLVGDANRGEKGMELTGKIYAEARGRGNIFFADGEVRLLGEAMAFRLQNLPVLLNPSGSLIEKWTYVEAPLLRTNNTEEIYNNFTRLAQEAKPIDKEGKLKWWQVPVSGEAKQQLISALQTGASGSQAWGVLARIFQAYEVKTMEVGIDPRDKEIREVRLAAGILQADGQIQERARLSISLSDYDKPVQVEVPPKEATVKSSVFSRIFGTGEIAPQE